MQISAEEFELLVEEALGELPEQLVDGVDNLIFVIEDEPEDGSDTTGWQAANQLLTGWGRRGHTLWSPPTSGLLARMRRASQARNLKLRELAARVIETGDEPESA